MICYACMKELKPEESPSERIRSFSVVCPWGHNIYQEGFSLQSQDVEYVLDLIKSLLETKTKDSH